MLYLVLKVQCRPWDFVVASAVSSLFIYFNEMRSVKTINFLPLKYISFTLTECTNAITPSHKQTKSFSVLALHVPHIVSYMAFVGHLVATKYSQYSSLHASTDNINLHWKSDNLAMGASVNYFLNQAAVH